MSFQGQHSPGDVRCHQMGWGITWTHDMVHDNLEADKAGEVMDIIWSGFSNTGTYIGKNMYLCHCLHDWPHHLNLVCVPTDTLMYSEQRLGKMGELLLLAVKVICWGEYAHLIRMSCLGKDLCAYPRGIFKWYRYPFDTTRSLDLRETIKKVHSSWWVSSINNNEQSSP